METQVLLSNLMWVAGLAYSGVDHKGLLQQKKQICSEKLKQSQLIEEHN